MTLSIVPVSLALVCVESALYGIFFVLAVTSLAVLLVRPRHDAASPPAPGSAGPSLRNALRSPLFLATCLLLMTVSAHWLTTVQRLFDAFVYTANGRAPSDYYLTIAAGTHVAATAFVVASVIVGDCILIYRIWVVWGRRFRMVIFPMLCTMGYAAAGISVVQLFAVFLPGESIFVPQAQRRIITTVSLTLMTNIYGTVSIAYRIWKTNRAMKSDRMVMPGMSLTEAFVIFVESAALYTFWTLFFLIAYSASSLLEDFAFHCIPAATGISFMLIIVRVGLGFSWAHAASAPGAASALFSGSTHAAAHAHVHGHGHADGALRMITLNVTRTVERETDFALPLPLPRDASRGHALTKQEMERERELSDSDSGKDVQIPV